MARPYTSHGRCSRPSAEGSTPVNHSRRSWNDNGVHYTVETTSFASPNIQFGAMSGSANGLLGALFMPEERGSHPQVSTSRGFGTGLLGTAFNLLGAVSDMRNSSHTRQPYVGNRTRQMQVEEFEDEDEDDDEYEDDLAYGEPATVRDTGRKSRSVFSRFKDKLADNRHRSRMMAYSREASPTQRPRDARKDSFQTDFRGWARSDVELDMKEEDSTEHETYAQGQRRPRSSRSSRAKSSRLNMIEALENAVEYHKAEARKSRKRLERASRQPTRDTAYLQRLLNELKLHEQSLATSARDLQAERTNAQRTDSRSHAPHHARPQPQRQPPSMLDDEIEKSFSTGGFGTFGGQPRSTHPLFAELHDFHEPDHFPTPLFGAFHNHFATFGGPSLFVDDLHSFFGMPGATFAGAQRKRPRFVYVDGGAQPQPQPSPGFANFTPAPPPRPPATLMTPNEAKRLFKMYNDQWSALSPHDANVPYPTRGLHAPALLSRETLWAPNVSTHPATWSDETVMQANVQLFFLNVMDLIPQYVEAAGTGRVEMGYERTRATPAQVQQLLSMLKKEKTRWHSDRLGRRHGGKAGPNEALQNDARARAVFHAVCELMETAQ